MNAPRKRHSGFTLLEAIVAMVLISTAGLALFTWINASLLALHRVQETNLRSEATLNVLEYMERVNPMIAPDGRASLAGYALEWHAKPASPLVDNIAYPRGLGLYRVALYDTRIAVRREPGGAWFDLQLRQVGYQRVRTAGPKS